MFENLDWSQLVREWQKHDSAVVDTASIVAGVRKASRFPYWRLWLLCAAACVAGAAFTATAMLHRSLSSYTFTIVGWSAVLSFVGAIPTLWDFPGELALPTTRVLAKRASRLTSAASTLDFGRALVAVETTICAAFWTVLHHDGIGSVLPVDAAILAGGVGVYAVLSVAAGNVRRELRGLQQFSRDLERDDQHEISPR